MTVDEALQLADEWTKGQTFYEGMGGWKVAISILAAEVRQLRETESLLLDKQTRMVFRADYDADMRAAKEHIDRLEEGNAERIKHAETIMERETEYGLSD